MFMLSYTFCIMFCYISHDVKYESEISNLILYQEYHALRLIPYHFTWTYMEDQIDSRPPKLNYLILIFMSIHSFKPHRLHTNPKTIPCGLCIRIRNGAIEPIKASEVLGPNSRPRYMLTKIALSSLYLFQSNNCNIQIFSAFFKVFHFLFHRMIISVIRVQFSGF